MKRKRFPTLAERLSYVGYLLAAILIAGLMLTTRTWDD